MKRILGLAFALALLCVAFTASAWRAAAVNRSQTSVGLIPLTELGTGLYQGKPGGLYPGGSNTRPALHESAGLKQARAVQPLNPYGKPDLNGKIGLLSIGMSNTTQEFSTFKALAEADPDRNPKLVIVDGAQGGLTARKVSDLNSPAGQQFWASVDARIAYAGISHAQVQVAWVKQADAHPTAAFPTHALTLKNECALIAQHLKTRFPNLRLAYFSSRTYGGYANNTLNPEPYAYESGFAVKWLIEAQIDGAPELNFDPARGAVRAPWLAWGPYLWANGLTPRHDGLSYPRSDFSADGTHPAVGGAREKVARMLLDFFKHDSTAQFWFTRPQVLARR